MPEAEFIPSIRAPFARLHAAIPELVQVANWLRNLLFLLQTQNRGQQGVIHQVLVVSSRGQKKMTKDRNKLPVGLSKCVTAPFKQMFWCASWLAGLTSIEGVGIRNVSLSTCYSQPDKSAKRYVCSETNP